MAWAIGCAADPREEAVEQGDQALNDTKLNAELSQTLSTWGFTGKVQASLTTRLGRPLDQRLVSVGRSVFFDEVGSLNGDNTCGACHSPTASFGDTQSVAIGIDNNRIVGPDRAGPRNQRRTPTVVNVAFYPALMWNGRFNAKGGDPFSNAAGFQFPAPEGTSLSNEPHLLNAQAFIPPTERTEAAGFAFPGDNYAIRTEVIHRLNLVPAYHTLFGQIYPAALEPNGITYDMMAAAIAEFEFSLVRADAPIDRYARGDVAAMTAAEKRGALVFFGKGNCVSCHSVSGQSNEMFSDFENHVLGVPQLVPANTNVTYDGPGTNEDFGLEQVSGNAADRYAFRTSPLRNVGVQPAFFHDGAFTTLEGAIRHHLDVHKSVREYDPSQVDADLRTVAPMGPVLAKLDPRVQHPTPLSPQEFSDLVAFVRNGLLDPNARPEAMRSLLPTSVPSGHSLQTFE